MDNNQIMNQLKQVKISSKIIVVIFVLYWTYYTYIKIRDIRNLTLFKETIVLISIIIHTIMLIIIENLIDLYYSWMIVILTFTVVNKIIFKKDIIYNIILSIISLSFSFTIYIISVCLAFFPNFLFKISSEYASMFIILTIYFIIMYIIFKTKKIKYGIMFLKNKLEDSYLGILILNIGSMILFVIVTLKNNQFLNGRNTGAVFVVLSISMFITIKKSFELYYKQNLLTKDLEETKKELEEKKQEVEKLEKENLEFSKTCHSLAHKQKALEFKLEQLMKTKIDEDTKEHLKEEIENVSKELFKEPNKVELTKTGIESIDTMFSYMQAECIKDEIKFELQVVGSIFYMINNLISENDLEVLIADHIKDAIIAINNSENLNRSILVRIGKIDNEYSLYIYDSGIEFTKEVLDNLGKKPITTHADTGGTGMGFMNTFDTLNKTKASLIINEIGKTCEDNYTKVLIFKFDNQNEFKVNSYKNEIVV